MFQILIVLLLWIFPMVCFWKILPRSGYSPWWSLVCILPLGLLVLLGVVAFGHKDQNRDSEVF